MRSIGILLIGLAVLSALTIAGFWIKRFVDRKQANLRIFEPDLDLVNRPDLIGKVPENEDRIPDANAKRWVS